MNNKDKKFSVYKAQKDGKPALITINETYDDFVNKENLPWCAIVSISLSNPDPSGWPAPAEQEALDFFEDEIELRINEVSDIYFVARTTWNGKREIYFYIDHPEEVGAVLSNLFAIQNVFKSKEYVIEKDEEWEHIKKLLPM